MEVEHINSISSENQYTIIYTTPYEPDYIIIGDAIYCCPSLADKIKEPEIEWIYEDKICINGTLFRRCNEEDIKRRRSDYETLAEKYRNTELRDEAIKICEERINTYNLLLELTSSTT